MVLEGLAALETQDFDVILTDQKLPDGEGLQILEALSQGESATAVVVLTAFGTVEFAVETMRKGAFDFLTKPFAADNLKAVIARAAQHTFLRREMPSFATQLERLKATPKSLGEVKRLPGSRT